MKILHRRRIAEMVVCPTCLDIVGWFYRLHGPLDERRPFLQAGGCKQHAPRSDARRWPGFDFNRGVDLCYCCGIEPIASGSRWSIWFCDECKARVDLLNARHGRCVVPIGRHSVHWGLVLRGEDLGDPVVIESFVQTSRAMCAAIYALSDWHHLAVERNLEAIGATTGKPVPIEVYWRESAATVERMDRFREMCAYLDRRGRQAMEPVERAV